MAETTYTSPAIDGTTYTQSAGMDGGITTDNVVVLTGQAVTAAASAAADAVATAADRVATAQDVIDSAANAAAAIVAKLNWRGDWGTSTAFSVSDVAFIGGSSYICLIAHTSGTFSTDLSADRWELIAQQGATGADSTVSRVFRAILDQQARTARATCWRLTTCQT